MWGYSWAASWRSLMSQGIFVFSGWDSSTKQNQSANASGVKLFYKIKKRNPINLLVHWKYYFIKKKNNNFLMKLYLLNGLTYIRHECRRDMWWDLNGEIGFLHEETIFFELSVRANKRESLICLFTALFGYDFFTLQSNFKLNSKKYKKVNLFHRSDKIKCPKCKTWAFF